MNDIEQNNKPVLPMKTSSNSILVGTENIIEVADVRPNDHIGEEELPEREKLRLLLALKKAENEVGLKAEDNRAKLLMFLTKLFGVSLVTSFILVGTAINNPSVDKVFLKDIISSLITPQVTLLGGALSGYFLVSRNKDKKEGG
jgi:hypothetical protein